jgi:cytochrome c-type biogenesis protein CcmE
VDRKYKFLLGASVIVGAITYLIYSAARETSAYYVTMDEFVERRDGLGDAPLRLAGRVTSGSVKWNPRTLDLDFSVEPIPAKPGASGAVAPVAAKSRAQDARSNVPPTLPVHYNGVLPDMFADGRDVIVEGRLQGGTFHAKSLLTTCPSKYEAETRNGDNKADAASEPSARNHDAADRVADRAADQAADRAIDRGPVARAP